MSASDINLVGIVLAGGQSKRMGVDKALIDYNGKTQLETTFNLLNEFCEQVYVSVSSVNEKEVTRQKFPTIVDTDEFSGPLAGIFSAFNKNPDTAILVVACDLPLLNSATLNYLIKHRNITKKATAFISEFDGLPEPLCCIWEPSILKDMISGHEHGYSCPRKILLNTDIELLALPYKNALDNINTPKERDALHLKRL